MAKLLPTSSDKLNNPDHSFLHRVVAIDDAAPEQSVGVDSQGGMQSKKSYEAKNSGGNLLITDTGKTIIINSGSTQTINLPIIASANIGTHFTIIKLGVGKVIVQANTGQKIADSSLAGTIYDEEATEIYITITLEAVSTTQWVVTGAHGTWITT